MNEYPEKARCAYFNPLQIFNPVKSNSCVQREQWLQKTIVTKQNNHTLGFIQDTFLWTIMYLTEERFNWMCSSSVFNEFILF